jgi:hypothetical protein
LYLSEKPEVSISTLTPDGENHALVYPAEPDPDYPEPVQTGRGTIFQISPRTMSSLDAWLTASGLLDLDQEDVSTLPAFVGILNNGKLRLGPNGTPEPMDGKSIAKILQRHA